MENLAVIEHKNQRVLLTSQIAEAYETTPDVISKNFTRNREKYLEGKHYYYLEGEELKLFKANEKSNPKIKFAGKLYLWTEKGAFLHAKSINNDKAWEVYRQLAETYFNVKKIDTSVFSLQLQAFNQILQAMTNLELNQKKLEGELQDIRDSIVLGPADWRQETINIINKIATKLGGCEVIQTIKKESYELLERRSKSKLNIRETNMRRKVLDETGSKRLANKISKVDVIAADTKLREVYIAIIKEMAVKYGVA